MKTLSAEHVYFLIVMNFTAKQIMSADDHFTLIRLCKLQLIRARLTMSLTNILNLAFIETDTRLPR